MIKPNIEHFQKRMLRVPNNVRMLQYKMSGYEFNLKKFEQGVYDQLFFYIPNETEALGLLNEIGLMFPPDSMTRKKYYSLYQEKRIADLPEGYKMAIYFLIDNDLAQATLWIFINKNKVIFQIREGKFSGGKIKKRKEIKYANFKNRT